MQRVYILPNRIKEELLTMLNLNLDDVEIGVSTETGVKFIIGMFSYLGDTSYDVEINSIEKLDKTILQPKLSFEEYCDKIKEGLLSEKFVCIPFFFGQLSSIWNYWAGHESYVSKAEKVYKGKPLLYFIRKDDLMKLTSKRNSMVVKTDQAYESMLASSVNWRSALPVIKNIN